MFLDTRIVLVCAVENACERSDRSKSKHMNECLTADFMTYPSVILTHTASATHSPQPVPQSWECA